MLWFLQLGLEQAEARRKTRVKHHCWTTLELHAAVRSGHRRGNGRAEQPQLRGVKVVHGHLGGGGTARGNALRGKLRARDNVVLAREVAELERVARPRHLVCGWYRLDIVLHHALQACWRLEGRPACIRELWVDELIDLTARCRKSGHVLGQVEHQAIDRARVRREASALLIHITGCVAAREQEWLELIVLDVAHHLAPVGVRQLAHGADRLLGPPWHRDHVYGDVARSGDAERGEEVSEIESVRVLEEEEPLAPLGQPALRCATRV
mmetsp:Transcript_12830/g.21460  ORF Transcript_12830/g.21460 Transcript_12830/m.21460 type:complete len:267 (+) Transcript_12830:375-1175(+)